MVLLEEARTQSISASAEQAAVLTVTEVLPFQALDEEKLVYERSSSKNIYLNVAVNTLKKLRSKSSSCPSPVTSMSSQSLCSVAHSIYSWKST